MSEKAPTENPTSQEEIDRQIAHWAKRLQSRFRKTRREAAKQLGYLCNEYQERATRAIPALVQLFCDQEDEIRRSAARSFNDLGEDGMPALLDCLGSKDRQVVLSAIYAIRISRHEFTKHESRLLEVLQHADPQVRIDALGAIPYRLSPTPDVLIHVARGFTSAHPSERAAALASAAHLGSNSHSSIFLTPFRSVILAALQDEDFSVRNSAIKAMEHCELTPKERFFQLKEAIQREPDVSFAALRMHRKTRGPIRRVIRRGKTYPVHQQG